MEVVFLAFHSQKLFLNKLHWYTPLNLVCITLFNYICQYPANRESFSTVFFFVFTKCTSVPSPPPSGKNCSSIFPGRREGWAWMYTGHNRGGGNSLCSQCDTCHCQWWSSGSCPHPSPSKFSCRGRCGNGLTHTSKWCDYMYAMFNNNNNV